MAFLSSAFPAARSYKLASAICRRIKSSARGTRNRLQISGAMPKQLDVLEGVAAADHLPSSLSKLANEVKNTMFCVNSLSEKRSGRKRKPHGYWNDLRNVERELKDLNKYLGRRRTKTVPKIAEMKNEGRRDLLAVIARYGGAKRLAVLLGWTRSVASKSKVSRARGRPRKSGLEKVVDLEQLEREAKRRTKVNEQGSQTAITKQAPKGRRRFQKTLPQVQAELQEFVANYGLQRRKMPTIKQMREYGRADLVYAITALGGFRYVASRTAFTYSRSLRWTVENLKKEILLFRKEFYPEQEINNQMPTETQLRRNGRSDLSYAIQKYGGHPQVRKLLGFSRYRT